MKKVRTTGDILLDMEPLLLELVEKQDLQWGDVMHLIYGYLTVHAPGAREVYMDETNPTFHYGHKSLDK